jgi:hypothetical protein
MAGRTRCFIEGFARSLPDAALPGWLLTNATQIKTTNAIDLLVEVAERVNSEIISSLAVELAWQNVISKDPCNSKTLERLFRLSDTKGRKHLLENAMHSDSIANVEVALVFLRFHDELG